jgi:hypothetical protein
MVVMKEAKKLTSWDTTTDVHSSNLSATARRGNLVDITLACSSGASTGRSSIIDDNTDTGSLGTELNPGTVLESNLGELKGPIKAGKISLGNWSSLLGTLPRGDLLTQALESSNLLSLWKACQPGSLYIPRYMRLTCWARAGSGAAAAATASGLATDCWATGAGAATAALVASTAALVRPAPAVALTAAPSKTFIKFDTP